MNDSRLTTFDAGEEPTRHDDPSTRLGDAPPPPHDRLLRTQVRTATLAQLPLDEPGALLLGRYRLQRRLGVGAFGTVYRARDERLDRDVAVKVLPRARVVNARFEREARAAARLQHAAIVTLYEAAVDDEGAYLVSELVKGRTLAELLEQGKLSDREILEVGVCLCDGLEHAHAQGVIHRDVKPSNVLVLNRPSVGGHRAKLTDFGVAHVVGGDTLTRTGDVIGTAAYMSPEQAQGREAGPESDLFAVALVLYEALSGVNPLRDGRRGPRRRAQFIPPLRRQRHDLPHELAAGIDEALRWRPDERGTLAEFRATLADCLPRADQVRGVVAPGWGADETDPEFGPEWHDPEQQLDGPAPGTFVGGGPLAPTASVAARVPEWLPRGLSAGAGGLMTAWLSVHLLSSSPLAPATMGLIAAGAVLLLPRLGWAAVVVLVAALAGGEGRPVGAIALLLVTVPPMLLLGFVGEGASLPAGAAALGVLSLGGAWPALAARVGRGWWQRAVVGAAGFVWLIVAGAIVHRNLYWLPARLPPTRVWMASSDVAIHQLLLPILRSGVLAGAVLWGVAAAFWPLVLRRRWPMLDLVVVAVSSAALVAAVQAFGARELRGAALGALLGAVIVGAPAVFGVIRSLRGFAGP